MTYYNSDCSIRVVKGLIDGRVFCGRPRGGHLHAHLVLLGQHVGVSGSASDTVSGNFGQGWGIGRGEGGGASCVVGLRGAQRAPRGTARPPRCVSGSLVCRSSTCGRAWEEKVKNLTREKERRRRKRKRTEKARDERQLIRRLQLFDVCEWLF